MCSDVQSGLPSVIWMLVSGCARSRRQKPFSSCPRPWAHVSVPSSRALQGDAAKVWKGLAEIFAELEKHPFTKAGSLCVESPDDLPSVSATASDRFVCLDPYGPFETSAAYYTTWAEQYLALIADGQLYPQFPVEAYLVYRFLQDNADQLSDSEDKFFLKHVDDKGDHLMVDEDLNERHRHHRLADGAYRSAARGVCAIPRIRRHERSLRG